MGVGGQRPTLPALPPGKRPGTHCTGGLVGPRAGLDRCGKSRLPPGFDPVHPVASRYTVYAIPTPYDLKMFFSHVCKPGYYRRWDDVVFTFTSLVACATCPAHIIL